MRRRLLPFLAGMLLAGCAKSPTVPDDQRFLTTPLGFHIQSTNEYLEVGGVLTPAHGERADRWWRELMNDLAAAGMKDADPENIRGYVSIHLRKPLDDQGSILYSDNSTHVGGYYDYLGTSLVVPGDYDQDHWRNRPSAQALKHEMLHHWCYRTMHHFCTVLGDSNGWTNHHWAAPNGVDIWDLTWH